MKLHEALAGRRAMRDFRPDPVPCDALRELTEAATLAPSYMNLQPWSFVAVSDPQWVSHLGREAGAYLARKLKASSPYFARREEIVHPQFNAFYNAPALILVCATQPGALAEQACAMAAQNLMLAAYAMGLGSCWVSHAMPWLASEEGRKALALQPEQIAVAPILIGGPLAWPLSPGRFKPSLRFVGRPDAASLREP